MGYHVNHIQVSVNTLCTSRNIRDANVESIYVRKVLEETVINEAIQLLEPWYSKGILVLAWRCGGA